MSEIAEIISNLGFPIAAFLLMFWQNVRVIGKNTEALLQLKDAMEILQARARR